MANLSLKLVVEKKKNRVVFVESSKEFVDILISFLTLPMGTIIHLLNKNSGLGCFDKLYESVENLDTHYLQTEACKSMLLQPRSVSEIQCEDLVININDLKPRRLYRCPTWDCYVKTHCCFSAVPNARCLCGESMDKILEWKKMKVNQDVFVKGAKTRFMISDDLHVTPISTDATLSLLERLGIKNADALEEMTVDISKDKILILLKRLLLSKSPLTDVFLRSGTANNHDSEKEKFEPIYATRVKLENESVSSSKRMRIRLLESKAMNKIIYAEAGEEFMDNLFSFLTFPLGSIVKLLNKNSSLGCVDQLYQSVEALCLGGEDGDYIKSEHCKGMLLSPKLAAHFRCSNQLLTIEEKLSMGATALECKSSHGLKRISIKKINPKLSVPGIEHGGGFAKESMKFLITNEMLVTPVSPTVVIKLLKEQKVSFADLTKREITCGEKEVLNLLKACLLSRADLDGVFSRKK